MPRLNRLDGWLEVVWWVAAALSLLTAGLSLVGPDAFSVGFSQLTLWVIAGWVLLVVWLRRGFRRAGAPRRPWVVAGWFLSLVSIPVEHAVMADLARRLGRPHAVRWVWVWSTSLALGAALFLTSAFSALTFMTSATLERVEETALALTMVASAVACVALVQYVRTIRDRFDAAQD